MIGIASMRPSAAALKKDVGGVERHKAISMYNEAPFEEITLDEFELVALDRLQVLRKIEDLKARNVRGEDFRRALRESLHKYMKLSTLNEESASADKRKDTISHFILRLAYCRSEDLRRWFLTQETALFRHRLEELSPAEMSKFIPEHGLFFEVVTPERKAALRSKLLSIPAAPVMEFDRTTYYRIPFWQASDLIGKRQVYLEGGFAYVPVQRVVTIVVARYRMGISKSLMEASNHFAYVTSDSRFGPLLQNMSKQYLGRDFGNADGTDSDNIKPGMLNSLAERSMPLCMKQLHSALNREHKLKHWGRLQYGLFLKGAGLSVDDAMAFWQAMFTKIMGLDQFQKQYAYNVRHMYGKEGKRTNYTPYSCLKIIMGNPPAAGDHHGCPYRHYDEDHLSSLLSQVRIGATDKDAILRQVKSKNYQLACQRHFEATHKGYEASGVSTDGVGNHPNAWMHASMEFHKEKAAGASGAQSSPAGKAIGRGPGEGGVPSPAAVVPATPSPSPSPAGTGKGGAATRVPAS
ncbi:unnamed protein product [Ectocarpus sp. 12 AP-2014]